MEPTTSNPFRRQQPPLQPSPVDHIRRSPENEISGSPLSWIIQSNGGVVAVDAGGPLTGFDVFAPATPAVAPVSVAESESPSSTPTPKPRSSKPPPPVVSPRKRASRIEPLTAITNTPAVTTTTAPHSPASSPDTLVDPFNGEGDDEPETQKDVVSAFPNPFLQRAKSTSESRRSFDLSQMSGAHADSVANRAQESNDHRNRQSLDVDAFKRLMLSGQITQAPIAADNSSCSSNVSLDSRRSVSEPLMEGAKRDETAVIAESTPGMATPGSLSRSSSTRVKPPPPKPRTRSGGKSSLSTSVSPSQTTPSSPTATTNRPPSLKEPDWSHLPAPLPPPPPPPPASSAGPAEAEKKHTPPPPPLSRRQSVQRRSTAAVEKSESIKTPRLSTPLPPPPPPPMRRAKSVSTRNTPGASAKDGASPIQSPPPPPPPPPPHRRSRSSMDGPENGQGPDVHLPVLGEDKEREEMASNDILVDLQKLQRKVDELRRSCGPSLDGCPPI